MTPLEIATLALAAYLVGFRLGEYEDLDNLWCAGILVCVTLITVSIGLRLL
jgi:hypothetical protein